MQFFALTLVGGKRPDLPELPETETIASDLNSLVRGEVITSVQVARPDVLREVSPAQLGRRLRGLQIGRVWRRAKYIILDFAAADSPSDAKYHLVVQPRFTGGLLVAQSTVEAKSTDYVCLTFGLKNGQRLLYRDVRRLGTVSLMSPARWLEYSSRLGPEPLDPKLVAEAFSVLIRSSGSAIKKVLMDPKRLAGVGNIYANEALWHAGIDPSRKARSLSEKEAVLLFEELKSILRASIAARGTSFRDYRDALGRKGSYVQSLSVYGRSGQPCLRCGRELISTHTIDGRSTVFCSHCQV